MLVERGLAVERREEGVAERPRGTAEPPLSDWPGAFARDGAALAVVEVRPEGLAEERLRVGTLDRLAMSRGYPRVPRITGVTRVTRVVAPGLSRSPSRLA